VSEPLTAVVADFIRMYNGPMSEEQLHTFVRKRLEPALDAARPSGDVTDMERVVRVLRLRAPNIPQKQLAALIVNELAAARPSRLDVEADAIISELRALIAIMEERISIREKTT
jgi:hypothetical protein